MTVYLFLSLLFCSISNNYQDNSFDNLSLENQTKNEICPQSQFLENHTKKHINLLELPEILTITIIFKIKLLYKKITIFKITEKRIFEFQEFVFLHKNLSEIIKKQEVLII